MFSKGNRCEGGKKNNPVTLFLLLTMPLLTVPSTLLAQTGTADQRNQHDSRYIPSDAIAAAFLTPSKTLKSPSWEIMPIEVIQAVWLEHIGIDPMDILSIKLVVGPITPIGPTGGMVIQFHRNFDVEELEEQIFSELSKVNHKSLVVYERKTSLPSPIRLHQPDPQTLIVAADIYLDSMLSAQNGVEGKLPDLARLTPYNDGITFIAVLDQIRPLLTGTLRQPSLPSRINGTVEQPATLLRAMSRIAELTDAVQIAVPQSASGSNIAISLIGQGENSALEIEKALNSLISFAKTFAKAMASEKISQELAKDGPIAAATSQYFNRLTDPLVTMITPRVDGNTVIVNLDSDGQFGPAGTTVDMAALLLNAVEVSREASRRMLVRKNLDQIGTAVHNYESTYHKLPNRAITDEDGNPLLSWRVAILPFIGEEVLYRRFHLDEPWDSPNNLKLLPLMPKVYSNPSASLPDGWTPFQVPQGEKYLFANKGERVYRDVLDGLSNTIMVIETSKQAAVPWTKPQDVEIEATAPLALMGNTHPGGFHALLASRGVLFITHSIDIRIFNALLTPDGREDIDDQFFDDQF